MTILTWDYDTNTVTEWCRMGDCNHCGECCRVKIYLKDDNPDDETDKEGIWHQHNNLYWGDIKITKEPGDWDCYEGVAEDDTYIDGQGERCPGFSIVEEQRGKCGHNSKRKKQICEVWPLHPDHVECFDNCSYRFVKLNEREIEAHNAIKTE